MTWSRRTRGWISGLVAVAVFWTAAGSMSLRAYSSGGSIYPPALPPGYALEAAGTASGSDGRTVNDGAAGGWEVIAVDERRAPAAAGFLVAEAASAAPAAPSPEVLVELARLTGLDVALARRLCERRGDWRAVLREAPIYRAITERLGRAGGGRRYVIEALEQGADPRDILDALEYFLDERFSLADLPGSLAKHAQGAGWDSILDPLRTRYGRGESSPLSKDEIRRYLAQGLQPQDILESVGLGAATGRDARRLLTERLGGRSWTSLASAYDAAGVWKSRKTAGLEEETKRLLGLGYELAQVRMAQTYARALGLNPETVLRETAPGLSVSQAVENRLARTEKEDEDASLERLSASYGVTRKTLARWLELGLNDHEVENVLRLARQTGAEAEALVRERLGGATWDEILSRVVPGGNGGA